MSEKDGGPAFPSDGKWGNNVPEMGMSLRDYFAIRAPEDDIASISGNTVKECGAYLGVENYVFEKHYLALVAKARYQWADAMLKERAK